MTDILIPVSPGDLLDRITILRIKTARMTDPAQLGNVRHELELLERTWNASTCAAAGLESEIAALRAVNERLWDVEDAIRDKERLREFDAGFIELARAVYVQNDERAAIKRRINAALGSPLVEEKSYRAYRGG